MILSVGYWMDWNNNADMHIVNNLIAQVLVSLCLGWFVCGLLCVLDENKMMSTLCKDSVTTAWIFLSVGSLFAGCVCCGFLAFSVILIKMGHCFVAGTQVTMADGTTCAIEYIRPGNQVLTIYEDEQGLHACAATVATVARVPHRHFARLKFQGSLKVECTADHPLYLAHRHSLASVSGICFGRTIDKLIVGSRVLSIPARPNGARYKPTPKPLELVSIDPYNVFWPKLAYNVILDTKATSGPYAHLYFAGGVAVHDEVFE